MFFQNSTKLAVAGLSAIAFFGVSEIAQAADIQRGTDYFVSPAGGSNFVFNGTSFPLQGKPLGLPGLDRTDTVVERQADCNFVNGECTIPIEMTELSLVNTAPVVIPGMGSYSAIASLNPNTPTTGEMTINSNGTFSSFLDVFYLVELTPLNGGPAIGPITENLTLINSLSNWSHDPAPNTVFVTGPDGDPAANCHGDAGECADDDFFTVGLVRHSKPNGQPFGHTTRIASVPEPSSVLATLAVFGGIFGLKRKRKQNL